MSAFTGWWAARTLREQRLLLVMAAMIAGVAAWLLVVRPLGDAEAYAKARYERALDSLAEARAQAAAIERIEREPVRGLGAPLESFLGGQLAEAGFAAARVSPAGPGRATVAIDAARPQALFVWLDAMQARGLVVERLRAAANSDRSLGVEAVLRLRGR